MLVLDGDKHLAHKAQSTLRLFELISIVLWMYFGCILDFFAQFKTNTRGILA